jgi:signal transduction histidine kinase
MTKSPGSWRPNAWQYMKRRRLRSPRPSCAKASSCPVSSGLTALAGYLVGYTEVLPALEPADQWEAPNVMTREAQRAATVVRHLLEITAQSGSLGNAEHLPLASVLIPALSSCVEHVPSLEVQVTLPDFPAPRVWGNRERVR